MNKQKDFTDTINSFNIKELEKASEYDGHKPEDVTRLLSLEDK